MILRINGPAKKFSSGSQIGPPTEQSESPGVEPKSGVVTSSETGLRDSKFTETLQSDINIGALDDSLLKARIGIEKANRPDLANAPSGPERLKAHHETLQIDGVALKEMASEEIFDEIIATPMFIMMVAFPEPDGGLARFETSYNGIPELLGRPDAAAVILDKYRDLSTQIEARSDELQFSFSFPASEVMLGADEVLSQLDVNGYKRVIESVVESLDRRADFDRKQSEPVYGQAIWEQATIPIAKSLERLSDPDYVKWKKDPRRSGLLSDRPPQFEETLQIIQLARKYVQHSN